MREKKQFNIPKNYEKKFEWVPGVTGLQTFVFVPVIVIDYFIVFLSPLSFDNKIIFAVLVTGIPWTLLAHKPLRENVSLFRHLMYRLKFMSRQKVFHYRKEGYVNEFVQTEDKGREATGKSTTERTGAHTIKVTERRKVFNS